jgi:hypothetical protein
LGAWRWAGAGSEVKLVVVCVAMAEVRFMLVWGGAAVVKPMLDLLSASSPPVVIRGRCSGSWRWLC